MGRPRKIIESINDDDIDKSTVKSSQNFPVFVYDPTSILPRIMQAYSQEELDRYISGGWSIQE